MAVILDRPNAERPILACCRICGKDVEPDQPHALIDCVRILRHVIWSVAGTVQQMLQPPPPPAVLKDPRLMRGRH